MKNSCVIIPAIKKNGIIPDQLIKKLNGITLIQRAINTAKKLDFDIYVVTDSQEISLIAERNSIKVIYNSDFKIQPANILDNFRYFLKDILSKYKNFIIYRANTPLVDSDIISSAYQQFIDSKKTIISVKKEQKFIYTENNIRELHNSLYEINSFIIISSKNLKKRDYKFKPFTVPNEKAIEIESFQDWWICEKLLQRKKIVIHTFGSTNLGMGHIYRSLALAHEITNHEVVFICNKKYELAVKQIASKDYKVITTDDIEKAIFSEKPDLVINDVLNTEKTFIQKLKNISKVVNFEDLGTGSEFSDFTINELYEQSIKDGNNFLWGHKYYFLRDEFEDAKPHQFSENIESILITFGGSDRNNLTLKTLNSILSIAKERNIKINIVCGSGYLFREELETAISKSGYQENIFLTFASGVISKIMENSQIAISSNGRTVYELADMNIPAIVISQHEREATHSFATLDRGFINIGVIKNNIEKNIFENAKKLILDSTYRELLFLNIKKYNFRKNKKKVVDMILELID